MKFRKLWHILSNFGVQESMAIETSRKIILTNQLAVLAFLVLILMNVAFAFTSYQKFDLPGFLGVLTILLVPISNKYGNYRMSSFLLSTLTPLFTLFFTVYGKTHMAQPFEITNYYFPRFLMMGSLVLPLILIDSRNKILLTISVLINLACLLLFDPLHAWLNLHLTQVAISYKNYYQINVMILFPYALILFGFIFLNNTNNRYEKKILGLLDEVKYKNEQLLSKNEEITAQRDEIEQKNEMLSFAKQENFLIKILRIVFNMPRIYKKPFFPHNICLLIFFLTTSFFSVQNLL